MKRPPRSLQGRLLALVLAVVAGVWVAAAVLTWVDVSDELDELLDSHLAQAAALLVVQQGGEVDDDRTLQTPTLHRYAPQVAFQVFHEGRPVLRSANAPQRPMVEPGREFRAGFRTVRLDGTDWRIFATRGAERDVQVFVGEQLASRRSILGAVLRGTLWPLAAALPLLAGLAWWAIRRGLLPLRRLGEGLARRKADSLQPLTLERSPAELDPVVGALNGLFERIAALLEAERRFTADAAHELRTPIAAIRAQAQVALAEGDEPARRHALRATLKGCDRATRLVEQLLALSRLEAQAPAPAQPVDVAALSRRVVAALAPHALAKAQRLELDATDGCAVAAEESLLEMLLRNLVDNAVRYSPPQARVQVSVRRQGERVLLQVEDGGPGLAPEMLARLGQRFWRPPGQAESGSGLGWSIVRRIAAVLGLQLSVQRSAALGGLAVEISAPAAAAPAAR